MYKVVHWQPEGKVGGGEWGGRIVRGIAGSRQELEGALARLRARMFAASRDPGGATTRGGAHPLLIVIVYLLGWYLLDKVAQPYQTAPEISIWYPPFALDFVLLLVFGLRYSPLLLLNTLIHEAFVSGRALALTPLLLVDLGNLGACVLLLGVVRIDPRLRRVRDVGWFLVIAAVGAGFFDALLQVLIFVRAGVVPQSLAVLRTLHFTAGIATGVGLLAPPLLLVFRRWPGLWARPEPEPPPPPNRLSRSGAATLELLVEGGTLALAVYIAYGSRRAGPLDYDYLVFVPLLWIALRHGFERTTFAVLAINVGAALLVRDQIRQTNGLALQFGLMTVTLSGLLLGAFMNERRLLGERLARSADELGRSEARLRTVYEAMACGVIVLDEEGAIVDANAAALQILGLDRAGLGRSARPEWRPVRADGTPLDLAELPGQQAVRDGRPVRGAVVGLTVADGRRIWVRSDVVPVPGVEGTPSQVVVSFVEVTEQVLAEAEAKAMSRVSVALAGSLEPSRLYEVILQQAITVLPCDHAEVLLYRDGWVVVVASWGEPCVPQGTPILPLDGARRAWMPRDDVPCYVPDTALEPGWRDIEPWVGEHRIRSVIAIPLLIDGELLGSFDVDSYAPDFYTERQIQTATAFGERISQALRNARLYAAERERAREAEALARVRADLVGAVSHELRTPLTAIMGFAAILQERWGQADDRQRLRSVEKIVLAADRLHRLVEDLLLATRSESSAFDLRLAPMPLHPIVARAAMEIEGSYRGQRIDLQGPQDLEVLVDTDCAVRIVVNLLDNAAKYSPEGRPIAISWRIEGAMAVLRVRDHGRGMSEQGRELLFTRFGRVPGSQVRAGRVGTGLGLYLGRQLSEAMGGTLELEETGPEGSTFRLCLPLAAASSG